MFLFNTIIQSLLRDHFTGETDTGQVLKIQWEVGFYSFFHVNSKISTAELTIRICPAAGHPRSYQRSSGDEHSMKGHHHLVVML